MPGEGTWFPRYTLHTITQQHPRRHCTAAEKGYLWDAHVAVVVAVVAVVAAAAVMIVAVVIFAAQSNARAAACGRQDCRGARSPLRLTDQQSLHVSFCTFV